MGPDIALAASAREWPDRFHRHLLDHGGGRVVTRIMGSDQAVESSFDLLLIDDVCSFLTPRLVGVLKQKGAQVIGVFAPDDGPDAKRRLLECGISDVIEADAAPEEFLKKVGETLAHGGEVAVESSPREERRPWSIGVTGATDGVGMTEVAVGLACAVSEEVAVTLVDLDPDWPSVAQRLDLPLHPNIRTALDLTMHTSGGIDTALRRIGDLAVLGGVADQGVAAPLSHGEVWMLFDALGGSSEVLVADMGPMHRAVKGVARSLDTMAVVGTGDPVGVARLLRTVESAVDAVAHGDLVVVVNKTPRKGFHEAEIRAQITASFPDVAVVTLPFDHRLADSSWEGATVTRGPFAKAVWRMAGLIIEALRP